MAKLELPILRSGYSIQDGNDFVAVELDGGMPRVRQDKLNAVRRASVEWALTESQQLLFEAFYRTGIQNGSLPFTTDLILDSHLLEEYEVRFVPNTREFIEQTGKLFRWRAELWVLPQERNAAYDTLLINTFAANPKADLTSVPKPPTLAKPERNGTIPNQINDNGETIAGLATATFFTDPSGQGLTYAASNLPGGLSIFPANGFISGTISEIPTTKLVTVIATNAGGSATQQFTWQVNEP